MDFKDYPLGAIPSPKDDRDYQLTDLIVCAPNSALPSSYINPLVSKIEILDQGASSECVACSLVYLRWLCEYNQSNNQKQFSPSYIYANRNSFGYMGEGMIVREALSQLKKFGTCFYEDFPGFYDIQTAISTYRQNKTNLDEIAQPFRISSYYSLQGINSIKNGVMKIGGISANFPVYECLYYPDLENKIRYDETSKGSLIGYHEMTIVGWTETHWIVLNSWGKYYGDNGICYIPFDYPIVEAWAIIDQVMEVIFKMAKFLDTEGHWAETSIDKAAEKGIVKGYEDGSFKPNESLTRAQLCAILDRLGLLD